jgi:beta-lactamase superfamily II metal-dependent hydrolase
MPNKAKEVIVPDKRVFRIVFLYVGQGDSTLLVIPDGDDHKYALVDSHQDESSGGIDILKLLTDLFKDEARGLDVYINTHPHKDHLGLVKQIKDKIGIEELWHSGHKPGGDHKEAYKDLEKVIEELGDDKVFILKGSREENKLDDQEKKLGDINYNVLAPAEYVSDEVDDEKADERYRRIHEQCGVMRFKYGRREKQILITGDADYDAWTQHITDYHKDRLPSLVLSAVHHGSNTFFWKGDPQDEEPYKDHLNEIGPTYVVVSAPKSNESPHDHPHKEAMKEYRDFVGDENNVMHLGAKRRCVIVDITDDGDVDVYYDEDLIEAYGKDNEEKKTPNIGVITRVDKKPMGSL